MTVIFSKTSIWAEAASTSSVTPKKYNLSICAVFKDENKYLKEWLEYHQSRGVDHFYLYNINSVDRPFDILRTYIRKGLVTLINWPDFAPSQEGDSHWALSTLVSAYENAARVRAIKETEWLVFLDVDEFLIPACSNKLVDILERYHDCSGIILSEDCFDASTMDIFPKKSLVIETVHMTAQVAGSQAVVLAPEPSTI
jgi:hypothetical protein